MAWQIEAAHHILFVFRREEKMLISRRPTHNNLNKVKTNRLLFSSFRHSSRACHADGRGAAVIWQNVERRAQSTYLATHHRAQKLQASPYVMMCFVYKFDMLWHFPLTLSLLVHILFFSCRTERFRVKRYLDHVCVVLYTKRLDPYARTHR